MASDQNLTQEIEAAGRLALHPPPQLPSHVAEEKKNKRAPLSHEHESGPSKRRRTRFHWTLEEDRMLTRLVLRYGPRRWSSIAKFLNGKTGRCCNVRWLDHLDPRINREPFTEEDDRRLMEAQRRLGSSWSSIATLFPDRSYNAIKRRCYLLNARLKRSADREDRERPTSNNGGGINGKEAGVSEETGSSEVRPFYDFLGVGA